ncbi:MAG: UDP-N-acetylglucosamine 2-epimerase (non-hydrolyzing) [candidate division NC10 bacterium]|nr:UDP-N-acetylglucosamine 2-epimerase (non-hydrolyzing) [candidate division NC10 bacterium]MDE2321501.1 UDP-N-acetylglucosamine 2-epimerase (non-hydrolyzing) [candidate division NC10 bacterium]
MKIVTIVGARPQFIKCAPVSREFRKVASEVLVHTGQHYDDNMSDLFFRDLEIPKPDYNLCVGSGSHGAQSGEMLKLIEEVLLKERPDYVVVFGDTNSTLAGALAAAKLHIPVAHVEAGLRSFNRQMPEEINRVITDHLSSLLFCPTETAVKNLAQEGITKGVELVGDVMYEALLNNLQIAECRSAILTRLNLQPKGYFLATIHRAENTDDGRRLQSILVALQELSAIHPVIWPVHPRTRLALESHHPSLQINQSLRLIDPVSYLDMLVLEKRSHVILTDSGGVQKEAYWFGVPCVTLRDETEWVETVEQGWNTVAGTDPDRIVAAAKSPAIPVSPLRLCDDGRAAERVVGILAGSWKAHVGSAATIN